MAFSITGCNLIEQVNQTKIEKTKKTKQNCLNLMVVKRKLYGESMTVEERKTLDQERRTQSILPSFLTN